MRLRRVRLFAGGLCVLLLLACRLPGPPDSTGESAAPSPAPTKSAPGEATPDAVSPVSLPEFPQRTPLLLAAVGGFLFLITGLGVYFLIRHKPRKTERRAVADDRLIHSDELPAGTLLDVGRYLVLGTRSTSEAGTIYEVKATHTLAICPHCYASSPGEAKPYCSRCGARFAEATPEHPILLAREARDPQRFAVMSELLGAGLSHRAVVMPLRLFTDTSFGPARYYQVEPNIQGQLASQVNSSQPLAQVLGWGISLARGLEALHEHTAALESVAPDRILIDGNEARWLCLEGVRTPAGESEELWSQLVAANVRDLARLVFRLATGKDDLTAAKELPEAVGQELSQVVRSHGTLHAGDFAVMLEHARQHLVSHEPVRFLVGRQTDVGHARKLNEDSLIVLDMTALPGQRQLSIGAFAVADGVGGHAAGDVASRLTVTAIARFEDDLKRAALTGESLDPEAWLVRAARAANEAVRTERAVAANDMSSTLVMALALGRAATILNVGDSRAYWLRPEEIHQITTDHSLVQRLVEIGQLTPEEARHHPQKSVIYRVIGDNADLAMDLFDVLLAPGEAVLLCSDGLSDMVLDDVIWHVWRDAASPQAACDRLVERANEAGGYDNITVVIVQIAQETR